MTVSVAEGSATVLRPAVEARSKRARELALRDIWHRDKTRSRTAHSGS
jgi:hypothetical protein